MAKKTKVFRLLHLLTMVNSNWVGKWMRIGWRHLLQSSGKVLVYLLVRPPQFSRRVIIHNMHCGNTFLQLPTTKRLVSKRPCFRLLGPLEVGHQK